MDKFLEAVAKVNDFVNGIVWGWPMMILILGTGILLTVRTKALQVRKFGTSWGETIIPTVKSIGKKHKSINGEKTISPFEAFSTAISGTVGTGNIIGVSSAIMTGGPGAVFWMWISAFFGMVTNYAENVLGMYFRKKDSEGEFSGGPMRYLSEGIGRNATGKGGSFLRGFGKALGVLAAVFCTLAAIGMSGVQTNKISATFQEILPVANKDAVAIFVGVIVAVVLALIVLGGIKSIGRVASILVPFMSLLFIVMALIIIFANLTAVGAAFALIFKNIFSIESALSGYIGYGLAQIMQKGLARGIFSNEAGLGSSVIAHSASDTREPVKQGLWGVFEVFFDTFIICTLTALVVLVATPVGSLYAEGAKDTVVSMSAFASVFGNFGRIVYALFIPLFAFTTILAWSYYGEKCVDYLFLKTGDKGRKAATTVFKVAYVLLVIVSALIEGELAWAISDTCNGLMALPNLIGLIIMSGLVAQITKNYFDRKKGKDVAPMLSAYPEQNEQFIADLQTGNAEAESEKEKNS
ncbi:MAG: sodium:alanine symporter family protein [Clostridia bacterium]|nr:sodium:alanine symporter family protein [Clostridia bacterium]